MKVVLYEGMRQGDLNDLVLPLISVDEYESKSSKDAVAFGFYVHDEAAANDLNRFIQRSHVSVVSSEVSPAPDQHGFFVVFFELLYNDQISTNVDNILQEVQPLCGIESWRMRVRNHAKIAKFSTKELQKALIDLQPSILKIHENYHKSVLALLTPSMLEDVHIQGTALTLRGSRYEHIYEIVDYGALSRVYERNNLSDIPMKISLNETAASAGLLSLLGEGWVVSAMGSFTLVERIDTDNALLLRNNAD